MDLYGAWDPSLSSTSGANTPIRETADINTQDDSSDSVGDKVPNASHASGSALPAIAPGKPKPTIEQEIEQMGTLVSGMGKNLGSYWSSFRRQSEAALKQSQALASSAAKDLTPYLDKAKAELDKLNEQAKASAAAGQAASISELGVNPDNPSVVLKAPREDKGKGVDREGGEDPTSPAGSTRTLVPDSSSEESKPIMNATAFFSKLQTQLSSNPNFQNFQHTFQNMQHELKHKVDDFSKIDIHEAKEKYEKAMNSGEKYWKVASKELTDLFGEVVQIVPPEGYRAHDQEQTSGPAGKAADKRKKDAAVAAAGRKEMLLHRIRSEPAILLVDPSEPPAARTSSSSDLSGEEKKEIHTDTSEAFASFLASVQNAGGFASDDWKGKISCELDDEDGGIALKQTYESIVPGKITEEAFWMRYFFRKQQIEEDEARRREILEGATQQEEEDFSWDMEDESASSAAPEDYQEASAKELVSSESISTPKLGGPQRKRTPTETTSPSLGEADASWSVPAEPASPSASTAQVPGLTRAELIAKGSSTRNSSEEGTASSYDVVSAGDISSPKTEKAPAGQEHNNDSDSDWE